MLRIERIQFQEHPGVSNKNGMNQQKFVSFNLNLQG